MKKYLFSLIIISFLAGCGSSGGGNSPGSGDNNSGNTGGSKATISCNSSGKIAKVKVSKDGIYRFSFSDLYSACSSVSFSPLTIRLSNQGDDIPIDFVDSNSNGIFDRGDFIEFYGKAIGRDDSRFRFTETNVYWLSIGEKNGKRMSKVTPPPGQPTSPGLSYQRRLHMEEDTMYVQRNYPEIKLPSDVREHWFWGDKVYPDNPNDNIDDRVTHSFPTRFIDKTVPVSLRIRLQSVSFKHYIKVYINNNPVWNQEWDSQDPYDIEISGISAGLFNNGPNTLTIESAGGGLFYLDWFEVVYNREYKAEQNVVEFTGNNNITLSNFSSNDISVYEISDPKDVRKILISDPKKISEGDYAVSFSGPYDNKRLFLAVSSNPGQKRMSPVVEPYLPSSISSKSADYIIITHEDFADAIKPLADYRAKQGHTVLTVKVNEIYDEFGDGIETPYAIKAFLKYAYEKWAVKPVYVLLVGDATVDYKDLSGNGVNYAVKSYLPAYLYNYPVIGEVPSDNWFADSNDDILPDMNIGRIPAKFPDDVSSVVSKIMSHERTPVKSKNVVLIADDDRPDFEGLSDSLAELIKPPGYVPQKVYQRELQGGFKPAIISAINSNPLIVNYTGHGAVADWANNMFSSGDVKDLKNTSYPFVVALNCLNGYFVLADEKPFPSIAEAFILARDKGALAFLGASPWGYLSDHDPLAQELYNILFSEDITLGEAVTKAKAEAYTKGEIMEDVVQTFIFFGDPATKLK
ncbi:MAG: hypothetical protein IT392_11855 [Nitrospirae bacterium]|nr:hypothetical protein [Nitrospirota bacterium]